MGVIYKFKQEVVDFVMAQKQAHPGLSCRQLAGIVSKEFQLQVSKSSVNTILKQAQLSSPVGRRPHKGRAKSVKPPVKPFAVAAPKEAPPIKKIELVSAGKPSKPPVGRGASPSIEAKIFDLSHQPAPPPSSQLYDGLGNIFLKAIEWSLSSKPVLGEILKDHAKAFPAEDVDAASEILLYLRSFGMAGIEDLPKYKGSGLWKLNQLSSNFDHKIVVDFYHHLSNMEEAGFKLANEIDQLFTEIAHFTFTCEDGLELSMDAQCETIFVRNVHSDKLSLYNKLLSNLTSQIINPQKPTVIQKAPGQAAIAKEFYDFLTVYENTPGKRIKSVSLFDAQGAELSRFSAVPAQKRFFIVGIWPWQKEYDLLVSHISGHRGTVPHPLTNQTISFKEISTPALVELTRQLCGGIQGHAIYINNEDRPQNIILTNIASGSLSPAAIVSAYFLRWPNMEEAGQKPVDRNAAGNIPDAPAFGFWESIDVFLKKLRYQAGKQFFGPITDESALTDLLTVGCNLPGYWQETQWGSIVNLIPPGDLTLDKVKILQAAASRLNQTDIVDPAGKRVFVKIL